jgi:TRAP-type C4-dicarboxylate transport system permease small subunit
MAALMMMIGGVQWMTTEGDKGAAKRRIRNAVVGLMLILGSYILLYSINENLTNLNPLRLEVLERKVYDPNDDLQVTDRDTFSDSE